MVQFLGICFLLLSSSVFGSYEGKELMNKLGIVWGIESINRNEVITTSRNGNYFLVNLKKKEKLKRKFPLSVGTGGQGGLLDVVKHPDFKTNGLIYFSYSKAVKGGRTTALAIGKWDGLKKEVLNIKDVFVSDAVSDKGVHFGSRLAFDDDKNLFMSIGDRGVRDNGQDLSVHAGKILRLTDSGVSVEGNPFLGNEKAKAEIWSYGHRNPQGLFWDKETKTLFGMEHGPRGGDEINVITKGANYGWAVVSHGKEYWGPFSVGEAITKKGMIDPIKVYIPSIAPSDLLLYRGKSLKDLDGKLISGALAGEHLNLVKITDNKARKEIRLLEEQSIRLRSVHNHYGQILIGTDTGKLLRLRKSE